MQLRAVLSSVLAALAVLAIGGCMTTADRTPSPSPSPSSSESPSPSPSPTPTPSRSGASQALKVPVEYYKLGNGLRVVFSEDHSVPVATVAVYYHIGFRIEPRDRTGFAHLFEHMMFQGSTNLGKMEFARLVQGNGGVFNGSTRFDFTNYFETVPSNTLETMLWAEADRMSGLAITQENLTNQIEVVKNEVKVNVLNQPYGGFPWLDVPQYANSNWYNAHNFYGELKDIDAAKLDEVHAFFDTFYGPDNAVLVVAGDFEPAQTKAWIEQYFGPLARRAPPAMPDISEPPQTKEKRVSREDRLAPRPALAIAYHVPDRWTPEYFALGVIDELLLQGEDSALHQKLVKERGYTDSVSGGINLIGNMFNYQGPMLWTAALVHDPDHSPDEILADFDAVIARLQNEPVPPEDIERALTKFRSGLYDVVGSASRFGLVDLLASFALFDDDPALINTLEDRLRAISPELIRKTAQTYLRPENRTVMVVIPGGAPAQPAKGSKP